ncbi:MAG: bifunctional DNA-formamidopyrimidine glycosylase/DNA-(apurinic or apyrimidinic site) lyase [Candidatus Puniceispirillaceae bacterium]
MPELPEVETVRSALEPVLHGQQISSVRLTRQDLRWPLPGNLPESLTGQICGLPWRRGKYILIPLLPSGKTLLVHLGMSGAIRLYQHQPAQFGKHDHFSVGLADGQWFVFSDPRRFGHLDLLESGKEEAHPLLSGMGVEPLSNHFSPAYLDRVLAARKQPIKTALLDQRLIAGLGNIYVSEALFRAGISPRRQARNIAGKRSERLVPAIRATLTEAISAGGTSLRDHIQPGGEIGYFVQNLKVYGREGADCLVCDKPIKMIRQGGRSGFYCPNCQR